MTTADIESLRYPIGRFVPPVAYSDFLIKDFINDIRHLPSLIELAVQNLDENQLQTPYRPGGWTLQQLVHHIADSHVNAYVRFKLTLTESNPIIKPYQEAQWAELPDTFQTPVNVSLTLLHSLHRRWVNLLDALQPEDWERSYIHPEQHRSFSLKHALAMYAWHGKHHLAQVVRLKEKEGWQ